jgi:hypothetical protein
MITFNNDTIPINAIEYGSSNGQFMRTNGSSPNFDLDYTAFTTDGVLMRIDDDFEIHEKIMPADYVFGFKDIVSASNYSYYIWTGDTTITYSSYLQGFMNYFDYDTIYESNGNCRIYASNDSTSYDICWFLRNNALKAGIEDDGTYTKASDKKLKENIQNIDE